MRRYCLKCRERLLPGDVEVLNLTGQCPHCAALRAEQEATERVWAPSDNWHGLNHLNP